MTPREGKARTRGPTGARPYRRTRASSSRSTTTQAARGSSTRCRWPRWRTMPSYAARTRSRGRVRCLQPHQTPTRITTRAPPARCTRRSRNIRWTRGMGSTPSRWPQICGSRDTVTAAAADRRVFWRGRYGPWWTGTVCWTRSQTWTRSSSGSSSRTSKRATTTTTITTRRRTPRTWFRRAGSSCPPAWRDS